MQMTSKHYRVLQAVKDIGDPLLRHIVARCGLEKDEASQITGDLVRGGMLRMKEDDVDHEWAYRLTSDGKDKMGGWTDIAHRLFDSAKAVEATGEKDGAYFMRDVAHWLQLNKVDSWQEARELLESTNDNPNITPLPE